MNFTTVPGLPLSQASAESDFDELDDEDVLGGDAGEELPDYLR